MIDRFKSTPVNGNTNCKASSDVMGDKKIVLAVELSILVLDTHTHSDLTLFLNHLNVKKCAHAQNKSFLIRII